MSTRVCIMLDKFCSQSSIPEKSHHDHSPSYKGKQLIEFAYNFRGLFHYHHSRKKVSTQAGEVLEKELTILHMDQHAAGREKATEPLDWALKLQSLPSDTTSSNQTIPTPTKKKSHWLMV